MTDLRCSLRALHDDDRGTAITEFVITLPVFILSFVAILNLYAISDFAEQGKATAYARALEDFRTVQTAWVPLDWAFQPVAAGGEAGIWHNRVSASRPRDRAADLVLDPLPIAGGHMFESYSRILLSGPPSWAAETVELDPPIAHMTMASLMQTQSKSPITGDIRYGQMDDKGGASSVFAEQLNDDLVSISALGSGQKGWMGYMNTFLSTLGARPAIAAGMRYGVTTGGEFDETRSFGGWDYRVQTSTHIAVAPRPTDRWISIAVIRAYLGPDEAYDDKMLAFTMDVSTSAEAQEAQACSDKLSGISITDLGSLQDSMDVLGNLESGDPCGTGGGGGLGGFSNPLGFITGPLGNALDFFGGPVPTNTTTGTVNSDSPF